MRNAHERKNRTHIIEKQKQTAENELQQKKLSVVPIHERIERMWDARGSMCYMLK